MLGLTITSSWGNGHATTYRALLRASGAARPSRDVSRTRRALVPGTSRHAECSVLRDRAVRGYRSAPARPCPENPPGRRGHGGLLRARGSGSRTVGRAGRHRRRFSTTSTHRSPCASCSGPITSIFAPTSSPAMTSISPLRAATRSGVSNVSTDRPAPAPSTARSIRWPTIRRIRRPSTIWDTWARTARTGSRLCRTPGRAGERVARRAFRGGRSPVPEFDPVARQRPADRPPASDGALPVLQRAAFHAECHAGRHGRRRLFTERPAFRSRRVRHARSSRTTGSAWRVSSRPTRRFS